MKKKIENLLEYNRYVSVFAHFIYNNTLSKIKKRKLNRILLAKFDDILKDFNESMTNGGHEYFVAFGTLLGLYRDGSVLKHDLDIDVGVIGLENRTEIRQSLENSGFKLLKSFNSISVRNAYEETYIKDGVKIDVFYFTKDRNEIYCHDFLKTTKNKDNGSTYIVREIRLPFESFGEISYKGTRLLIPNPINYHLSARYGDDFMIQNSKWDYKKKHKCNTILTNDAYMTIY